MNFGRAGKLSNLEIALMMGNLNPTSTTRPCTQCNREVPKTQRLLTCDKCRASKKQQKARKKERDMAIKEGRGANGFSSAPLLAVIAKQEQETAAKRASRKGGAKAKAADSSTAESSAAGSSPASSSNPRNMGMVFQAILNEHQRDSAAAAAPKKKAVTKVATAKGSAGSGGAGTKRKLSDVEANEPGAVYDAETAKKRLRGDMPMPKLEPIPGSQAEATSARSKISTREDSAKTSVATAASQTSASKRTSTPLTRKSSNLPPPTKIDSDAKSQKVQASLSGWLKPAPKSAA